MKTLKVTQNAAVTMVARNPMISILHMNHLEERRNMVSADVLMFR